VKSEGFEAAEAVEKTGVGLKIGIREDQKNRAQGSQACQEL
jgi:hypothetical protein